MNDKFLRNIEKINYILEKVSVVLMLFLLFLTFANVVGRYVFSRSIFFADEMARFIFVWIVFLGIAKIVKDKRQVAVTLLSDRLSGTASGFILESFIAVCGLVFFNHCFCRGDNTFQDNDVLQQRSAYNSHGDCISGHTSGIRAYYCFSYS